MSAGFAKPWGRVRETGADLRLHSDEEFQAATESESLRRRKSFSSSPSRDGGVVESGRKLKAEIGLR